MRRAPPTQTLLLAAGLLAWGSIAQPFLVGLFRSPGSVREPPVAASLAAHAAYLGAFLWTALRQEKMALRARGAALLVQSLAGLALVHFRQLWLEAGLLAIVAAQASLLLPRAIRLGARGFLLKDIGLEQLADAIRAVAAGGTAINPALTERVLRGLERLHQGRPPIPAAVPLTPRETEVLRLMATGASNREIAELLGGAEGTIKNHTSSILSKLGVRDRTRAVLRAIELGIL